MFDGSSGSTGGIDFNAITAGAEDASSAVEDAKDQIGELADSADEFSLGGFGDTFSATFSDIGRGFATLFDAFNFDSDTQLQSLRTLNEMVKDLFGEDWTNFWEGVGATIFTAFNGTETEKSQALGEIQSWLERANNFLTGWMGEFGKAWSDFWKARGNDLYEMLNPGIDPENLPDGYTKAGVDSTGGKTFPNALGNRSGGDSRSGGLGGGGGTRGYSYADYSLGPQVQTSAWAFPGAVGAASSALTDSAVNKQPIEIHTTVELDGNAVGESVTTYQERENLHSNGY